MRATIVWVAALTLVLAAGVPVGEAGSQQDPDITDATGDAVINNQDASTNLTSPLQDGADIEGVWWSFVDNVTLEVGIDVVEIEQQDTSQTMQTLLTWEYTINYQFHRAVGNNSTAAIQQIDPTDAPALTITVSNQPDSAMCGDEVAKTFTPGQGIIACNVNSTAIVPEEPQHGDGAFFNTDMIMNGMADAEGTAGALTATDEASGMDNYFYNEGPAPPQRDDGQNGGNGNNPPPVNGDGGDDESTPGFEAVAVIAGLLAVALWSRKRRE